MNLGLTEMFFLFVLGLLLFGPKKLPEIGRKLGKAMMEFKRASTEFQSQLNDEVRKLEIETEEQAASAPVGTASRSDLSSYGPEAPSEVQSEAGTEPAQPERQNG